ncbi:chemotaxis protein [Bradyrhizobium sp. CCBAU 11386]|uniref:methyl-accepting chemotaxis protein n=1 Tax=Bradyrhizobium sp. CCBAU 11386 TaxID=1630837 RepID=UPI00230210AC|nr:methyl-accepting chemotaxis protein [Bradyrhizobium sp. CCBAU 11386]MDA9506744.1 chemotaxis protein [Bradyrhizobium sp. CCBAU 11386]
MISTLPIRSKMIALVAFLLLALAGTGLFAIFQMRMIDDSTMDIQRNWLPKVRLLGHLRGHTIRYGSVVRDHVLETEPARKAAAEKILGTLTQEIEKASAEYEPLVRSPEERALFADFQQSWSAYVAQVPDVLAASNRKEVVEATQLLLHQIQPLRTRSGETLLKAIDLNNRGAEAAGGRATETYVLAFRMIAATVTLGLMLGGVAGLFLVRDISRRIASIIKPMRALAAGELTVFVPHRGERNEIGRMADTLQVFKDALIAKRAADEAAILAADDKARRAQRVTGITGQFEAMIAELVNSLSSASTELEAAAGTLNKGAHITQHRAGSADTASRVVAENIQSVAAASEQFTNSVTEIARQVDESSRIARSAVARAEKTDASIAELSLMGGRIGEIVKLITAIADQTNLLALNATIEAARAGESGRGFAVVAAEVKALAAQTARATDEISAQILGMRSATDTAISAVRDVNATIGTLSKISATIAAAAGEQKAAIQEIARNIQEAAQLTTQVSSDIADVKHGTSETGSASAQVLSSAQSLSDESARLKMEVGNFLSAVQAA